MLVQTLFPAFYIVVTVSVVTGYTYFIDFFSSDYGSKACEWPVLDVSFRTYS